MIDINLLQLRQYTIYVSIFGCRGELLSIQKGSSFPNYKHRKASMPTFLRGVFHLSFQEKSPIYDHMCCVNNTAASRVLNYVGNKEDSLNRKHLAYGSQTKLENQTNIWHNLVVVKIDLLNRRCLNGGKQDSRCNNTRISLGYFNFGISYRLLLFIRTLAYTKVTISRSGN